MISGVYAIINKLNGNTYIGSSVDIQRRWREHKRDLEKNGHSNPRLQNAWNKHKGYNFEFVVLLECQREYLLSQEQKYLDKKPEYNLSHIAGHVEFTKEVREKQSAALRGRPKSAEHRANLSKAKLGKPIHLPPKTEEHKRKLSIAKKGKRRPPFSEEHRKRLSISSMGNKSNLGKRQSDERKRRASLSRIGRPHPHKGHSRSEANIAKSNVTRKINKMIKYLLSVPQLPCHIDTR